MSKFIEIDVEVIKETAKAFLVTDGDKEEWMPKSQIKTTGLLSPGGTYTIKIPEWLAKEKGMV
jgi:hypothetical protein